MKGAIRLEEEDYANQSSVSNSRSTGSIDGRNVADYGNVVDQFIIDHRGNLESQLVHLSADRAASGAGSAESHEPHGHGESVDGGQFSAAVGEHQPNAHEYFHGDDRPAEFPNESTRISR
jgi:hypothetical protein